MVEQPSLFVTILAFVAVLAPLIFIHEMGHYLVGRWFGVHAEAFSIGFGKELYAWVDQRGTRWRIAALPLGGYVRFKGDMSVSGPDDPAFAQLPAAEREGSFPSKALWQRALIVFAGPAINFLFAILILAGFAVLYGQNVTPPVVREVLEKSAAEQAGIREGDRILSIAGQPIEVYDDVRRTVMIRPGETVAIRIDRAGTEEELTATLKIRTETDRFGNSFRIGQLGVLSVAPEVAPVGLLEAPGVAIEQTTTIVSTSLQGLWQIITGRRSASELSGPLGIAKISGEMATLGWSELVFFVAMMSINLGFINLLPIPMLDGGHLLFYGIQAVARRPVSPQVQEWAYRSGFAFLMTLMLFVTFNDLTNFGLWRGLSSLIG